MFRASAWASPSCYQGISRVLAGVVAGVLALIDRTSFFRLENHTRTTCAVSRDVREAASRVSSAGLLAGCQRACEQGVSRAASRVPARLPARVYGLVRSTTTASGPGAHVLSQH